MSHTPKDQARRNRHPEQFGRPDANDEELKVQWTGFGSRANDYEWGHNKVHKSEQKAARPAGRATEELTRPPEITEYVPPVQPQVDAWSLTSPRVVAGEEKKPLKPTSPDPVSRHAITEFEPEPQKIPDPWSYGKPKVVESKTGTVIAVVPQPER